MQIGAIDPSSYIYEPYDIPTESLVIDNSTNSDESALAVNGVEAAAIAISPIPEESVQLQELQEEIVTAFDDLREGNISREDFSSALEELGVDIPQTQTGSEIPFSNDQNNQSILDLTSALIESVKGNANGGEVELSSYASIMDIVNQETQTPDVNEQLQAYTQNLRN